MTYEKGDGPVPSERFTSSDPAFDYEARGIAFFEYFEQDAARRLRAGGFHAAIENLRRGRSKILAVRLTPDGQESLWVDTPEEWLWSLLGAERQMNHNPIEFLEDEKARTAAKRADWLAGRNPAWR